MSKSIYAHNLFDISNKNEYLTYAKRFAKEFSLHGGVVLFLGKFKETVKRNIEPRTVFILVE